MPNEDFIMAKKRTPTPRAGQSQVDDLRKGAKKSTRTKTSHPLTVWDGDKYFDARFNDEERQILRKKLMVVCGYGNSRLGIPDRLGFEFDIERPARREVRPALLASGLDCDRQEGRFMDCALIHISRQLEIDYKSFAKNVPKLPIDGFISSAKRAFPEFMKPRNNLEFKIQEHKLHVLWCDWHDEECVRTGCTKESHWLCSDRFVERDYEAILDEVAKYNKTRPKLVCATSVPEERAKPTRQRPVLRIAVNNG
jgi:hypothetical protein